MPAAVYLFHRYQLLFVMNLAVFAVPWLFVYLNHLGGVHFLSAVILLDTLLLVMCWPVTPKRLLWLSVFILVQWFMVERLEDSKIKMINKKQHVQFIEIKVVDELYSLERGAKFLVSSKLAENERYQLTLYSDHLMVGCSYLISAVVTPVNHKLNKPFVDEYFQNWLKSHHGQIKSIQWHTGCYDFKLKGRRLLIHHWQQSLGQFLKSEGLFQAILFGDRSNLKNWQSTLAKSSQTIHLMVVSGMHMAMMWWFARIMAFLFWPLCPKNITRLQVTAILAIILSFGYAFLAGFSIPVVRAFLAMAGVSWFVILKRKIDWLLMLLWVCLLLNVFYPTGVFNIGFWLTMLCVALLLYFFSPRFQVAASWLLFVEGLVKAQLLMGVLVLILLAQIGLRLYAGGSIVNLVLIPYTLLILLPLALFGLIFSLAGSAPAWLLVLHNMTDQWFWQLAGSTAQFPELFIWLPKMVVLILVALLFVVSLPLNWPIRLATILVMLQSLVSKTVWPVLPIKPGELKITVFDVGQGLSVLVQSSNQNWLYDTGPGDKQFHWVDRLILPALKQHKSQLDALIISHLDKDHIGGYQTLAPKSKALFAGEPILAFTSCRESAAFKDGDVTFEFLDMQRFSVSNDNDYSCVLKVSIGLQSIIITGDLSKLGEYFVQQQYGETYGAIKVLGHHGSQTSSSNQWLKNAGFAVISTGYNNNYGHPATTVLARLSENDINWKSTIEQGQLVIMIDKNGYSVSTESRLLGPDIH